MEPVDASTRSGGWIPGVEGLRAFAACAILVLHVYGVPAAGASGSPSLWLYLLVKPMEEGVPLFFTLSGFLLWRPVASAVLNGRRLPSVRRYARNRALRILPAYWVILLVTALVLESAQLTPVSDPSVYGAITGPLLLAKDALLLQNYSPGTLSSGITPAWSLAVEVVFYMLLPLLALVAAALALRSSSLRRRVVALLVPAGILLVVGLLGKALTASLLSGQASTFTATWHAVVDRSFVTHADLFAFGMVVAVLRTLHEDGRLTLPARARSIADRVLVYSIPLVIIGFPTIPRYVFEPLFSLLCALLLARVVLTPVTGHRSGLVRFLERRPIVATGKASYSIFLWNCPVAAFLTVHGVTQRGVSGWAFATNLAIVVPAVAVCSAITYLGIERPAMRLRRAPRLPAPPAARPAVAPVSSA